MEVLVVRVGEKIHLSVNGVVNCCSLRSTKRVIVKDESINKDSLCKKCFRFGIGERLKEKNRIEVHG